MRRLREGEEKATNSKNEQPKAKQLSLFEQCKEAITIIGNLIKSKSELRRTKISNPDIFKFFAKSNYSDFLEIAGYDQYITDAQKQNPDLFHAVDFFKRLAIIANTGAGKSTAIESIAKHLNRQAFIAVPTQDICNSFKGDVIRVMAGVKKRDIERELIENPNKPIVFVYDSLFKVTTFFEAESSALFIDELHTLNSLFYRNKATEALQQFQKTVPYCIGLTGTAPQKEILSNVFRMKPVKVSTRRDKVVDLFEVTGEGTSLQKALHIIQNERKEGQKIVVRNEEKDENKAIQIYCKNHLGLNVKLYDNDNLDILEDEGFKYWNKTGFLPEDWDGVICTAKLAEGKDIKGNILSIHVNCVDPCDEWQFEERGRNNYQRHYSIRTLKESHKEVNEYWMFRAEFEKTLELRKPLERESRLLQKLKESPHINAVKVDEIGKEARAKFRIESLYLTDDLEINDTAILQSVRSHKNKLQGSESYYKELCSYAENVNYQKLNVTVNEDSKDGLKKILSTIAEEKKQGIETINESLDRDFKNTFEDYYQCTKQKQTKIDLRKAFGFSDINQKLGTSTITKEFKEIWQRQSRQVSSILDTILFLIKYLGLEKKQEVLAFIRSQSVAKIRIYKERAELFALRELYCLGLAPVKKAQEFERNYSQMDSLLQLFEDKGNAFTIQEVTNFINDPIYHNSRKLDNKQARHLLDVFFYDCVSYDRTSKKFLFDESKFDYENPFGNIKYEENIRTFIQKNTRNNVPKTKARKAPQDTLNTDFRPFRKNFHPLI